MNSDGESLICCSAHLVVCFFHSEEIVSDVGKSHVSLESVKLLTVNTCSDIEVLLGNRREKRQQAYLSLPLYSYYLTSITKLSVVCKAVW